jgi:PAS domain S-box-containing protein
MKPHAPELTGPLAAASATAGREEPAVRAPAVRKRSEPYDTERQLLAAIVNASHDAIWSWDADGVVTSWNAEAERLFGYATDEIIGKSLLMLVPEDRLELAREAVSRLLRGEFFGQYETVRVRKDGVRLDVELTVSPIYGAAGEIVGAASVCRDITQRKEVETRLRLAIEAAQHAQDQQAFLINELNHRVKNTLATVQSLAVMTSKTKAPADFADTFNRRLAALSAAHDLLTGSRWEYAALDAVVEAELAPYMNGQIMLEPSSVRILLKPKAALTLGLVFHELATNAAKHGALSQSDGRLDVKWDRTIRDGEQYLSVVWRECNGPRPKLLRSSGFGSRLIESSITDELAGQIKLNYPPTGFHAEIELPIENISR